MAMGGIARVSQVQLLQPFVTFALAVVVQRRDHHAANPAVRRRGGRNGGDLDAHPARCGGRVEPGRAPPWGPLTPGTE